MALRAVEHAAGPILEAGAIQQQGQPDWLCRGRVRRALLEWRLPATAAYQAANYRHSKNSLLLLRPLDHHDYEAAICAVPSRAVVSTASCSRGAGIGVYWPTHAPTHAIQTSARRPRMAAIFSSF